MKGNRMTGHPPSIYARVLFIAPSDSGLDVVPEVDTLSELGFNVRVLQGDVTAERIFAVCRMTKFGVLHFACHAQSDGVILSKGERFDIDSILQIARLTDAILVVLNACTTSIIGQTLVDESVPAVICTMREVPDHTAKQTAQAFYQHLVETGNAHEAYKASKPATRGLYQWLANGSYETMVLAPIMSRLEVIQTSLETNAKEHENNLAEHDALRDELRTTLLMLGNLRIYRAFIIVASALFLIQFVLLLLLHPFW